MDVRASLIISTILGVVRMSMSVSSLSIVSRAVSYQHESFSWSWTNPDGNCASEEVLKALDEDVSVVLHEGSRAYHRFL